MSNKTETQKLRDYISKKIIYFQNNGGVINKLAEKSKCQPLTIRTVRDQSDNVTIKSLNAIELAIENYTYPSNSPH